VSDVSFVRNSDLPSNSASVVGQERQGDRLWCDSLRAAAMAFLAISLGGCAAFSGYPRHYQNDSAVLVSDQPYLTADVRSNGNSPSDAARGGLTAQQYRDTVVYRRIEVIDIYYYTFEARLNGSYNGFDVGADLATLILNGLGAVTGTSATKASLAAASAGIVGAKSTINTDLFYQKTLPTLIAQMRAARAQALLKIETGLGNPVAKYSIDQALNDISAYYIAGTIPGAIAQINAQAGASTTQANAAIDGLRTAKFASLTANAQRIVAWLFPGGDQSKAPDSTKLRNLQNWMSNYAADPRLASIPYIVLLNTSDPLYEVDRAQLLKDLNIP
jgi:hypothetical protein